LKDGICPKCKSGEVYSGSDIMLKSGPFGSNSIPVSLTSIAALDNYICTQCGYVESYVLDSKKLKEISKKWHKAKEPDTAKEKNI
jgi:predicted nucleic-acid-binding Zn-ribbon protein